MFALTPLAVALQGIGYAALLSALQGLAAVTVVPSTGGGFELREDGGYELREDGGYELREGDEEVVVRQDNTFGGDLAIKRTRRRVRRLSDIPMPAVDDREKLREDDDELLLIGALG